MHIMALQGDMHVSTCNPNTLSQSPRLLRLDTPLGRNALIPVRAVGESVIGRQFSFTVEAVSTSRLALKTLIAQPVTLWIQQIDHSYRPFHGYVNTARLLGSDGTLTTYQLSFASWLHFLKFRKDARIWQEKSADQIIADVFDQHPQGRGAYKFVLSSGLPKRSFCMEYEDDWNFVHRLMEHEGLFGFFTQADDGKSHMLTITDNLFTFSQNAGKSVDFYRAGISSEADSLTHWSCTRALQSTQLTTRTFDYKSPFSAPGKGTHTPTLPSQGTIPLQAEVYEYTGAYTYNRQVRGDTLSKIRMEEWESRAKRFFGSGSIRSIDAGQWFTLQNHSVHRKEHPQDREFAVLSVRWAMESNIATSSEATDYLFSIKPLIDDARKRSGLRARVEDGHYGAPAGSANERCAYACDGSDDGYFFVEIEAQRRHVPFRSPPEHAKPNIQMQTATVAGPDGDEVHTDSLNRVKVKMHWDRLNSGDQNASCWVRVVQASSGRQYGSTHVPRIGEEVIISWLDDDCDRPICTGRLFNAEKKPPWHSNGLLSGFKSKEYGGAGYNQLVMDDATGQRRLQLYSSTAQSSLHLGYMIDHGGNTRGTYKGTGFDLMTSECGAVRAAQGLHISTYPAVGEPMAVGSASAPLANGVTLTEDLSACAMQAQAEGLESAAIALRKFNDTLQGEAPSVAVSGGNTAGGGTGRAKQFMEPVMLIASPSGIGLSTQGSANVAVSQNVTSISGGSMHSVSDKSLIASVTEKISMFVKNGGIKLLAQKGQVMVQAQSDSVELDAQKRLTVASISDDVLVVAEKGILLTSGGAYIRIADGKIELHSPGDIDVKGANYAFDGPTQKDHVLPQLPRSDLAAPGKFFFSQ